MFLTVCVLHYTIEICQLLGGKDQWIMTWWNSKNSDVLISVTEVFGIPFFFFYHKSSFILNL